LVGPKELLGLSGWKYGVARVQRSGFGAYVQRPDLDFVFWPFWVAFFYVVGGVRCSRVGRGVRALNPLGPVGVVWGARGL